MAKYVKGQSGNPNGRPASPHSQARLRMAMSGSLDEIVAVVRQRALEGDMRAADLILSRCLSPLRASDPMVTLPLTGDPGADAKIITQAAGAGEIGPGTAQQFMSAVVGQTRVLEVTEILARLEILEAKARGIDAAA